MEADWSLPLDEHAMDCAFHPERRLVAAGLVDGNLRVFDCSGAQPAAGLATAPHADSCRAVNFAAGGAAIITGAADRSLVVTDLEKQAELRRYSDSHDAAVTRCASRLLTEHCKVLATQEHCFASGDEGGVVRLWDARAKAGPPAHSFTHHSDAVSDLALHPAEPCLLAASADGSASTVDLRKHALAQQTEGDPDDEATAALFLKGGRKVLVASMTGVLTVHDAGRLDRPGAAFPGHPASVDCMAALDADSVVTGGGDGVLRVVSVLPNRLLGVLGTDAEGGCGRLAVSADGGLLAAVSLGPVLRLWDLQDGSEQEEEEAGAGEAGSDSGAEVPPPAKKARKGQAAKGKPAKGQQAPKKAGFFDDLL